MHLRTTRVLAVVFAGLLGISYLLSISRPAPKDQSLVWATGLATAMEQARQEKKVVLVDFYTDWCRWCKKLDAEVFANTAVAKTLEANFVLVRLNAEREGKQEATRFQVNAYPTVVFVDAQGRELKRIEGYLGPQDFLQELQDLNPRSS